jgi:hypothetical protein
MNYYDWMETEHVCKKCGWAGLGKDASLLEAFSECAEYGCPSCHEEIGVVAYPTRTEALTDPRADPADRMVAEIQQSRWKRHEATKLKSPYQLPSLDSNSILLIWDEDGDDWHSDNVLIRHGDVVIWQEMTFYENYRRFGEIATILRQKYGDRLKDLEPTRRSWLYLYGDSLSADGYVESVRAEIRAAYRGP